MKKWYKDCPKKVNIYNVLQLSLYYFVKLHTACMCSCILDNLRNSSLSTISHEFSLKLFLLVTVLQLLVNTAAWDIHWKLCTKSIKKMEHSDFNLLFMIIFSFVKIIYYNLPDSNARNKIKIHMSDVCVQHWTISEQDTMI
jgi:hypothetical protein